MIKRTILAETDTWSGYRSPRWLRGLFGYDIGDHGDLDYATVHRGGWEAAGPYYRAPWWLGGLQSHTTGRHGGWEGLRDILHGTVVVGRAAGP